MIEVKVTVELPGIPDALNNLARAIADGHCAVTAGLLSAPMEQPTPAPVAPVTSVAPVAAPAPAPAVPAAPVVAPAPAPVAAPAPAPVPVAPATPATEAPITQHALSVAGAKLVDMGKMDAVVNLLKQYGVVAITQLKEDQYASFAANLRGLGVEV